MRSTTKKVIFLVKIFFLLGVSNLECLAESKNSIINLFCIENFKEEMLKAKINYNYEIAKDTCDCYLKEFSISRSHQKAIEKCKLETKKKFNL
tara:strand:+ start:1940 stop:2218 length:279 start_codon:yes stop_codon:yes gene_type:complete